MRDAVESAAIAHKKAADREEAAIKSLAAVSQEAELLLQGEAASAAQEGKEILEKAQAEVRRIAQETERLVGVEQDEASEGVKGRFLELVVQETEESLRRSLKRDDHSAILRRAQNSIEVGV
jgi:F0F1-type ATP synthase membrane subunit b/b'